MDQLLVHIVLLAVTATLPEQPVQKTKDIIKLENICINVRYGYEYSIVSNMDYFQINISHSGVMGHVYVGYNPQILNSNRKWQSRTIRKTIKSPKIVSLEDSQFGQFLGVPVREDEKYFHLWFDGGDRALIASIKETVGFCK